MGAAEGGRMRSHEVFTPIYNGPAPAAQQPKE